MNRVIIRNVSIGILLLLVLLEVALRYGDPLRWYVVASDFHTLALAKEERTGYYVFTPGYYDLTRYDVTIESDGLRKVPDSGSGCHVLALGDSFTFGWGVNDEQTWVNLAARETGYRWTNGGLPQFSAANVAALLADFPADGYVYFSYNDDASIPATANRPQPWLFATEAYFRLIVSGERPDDLTAYQQALQQIQRENLIMLLFDNHPQALLARQAGGITIPAAYERIGFEDNHPSVRGQQQLWESLRVAVLPFLEDLCR